MTIKQKLLLSALGFLLLSACEHRQPDVSPSYVQAAAPPDMMQPRQTPDMFGKMNDALSGAQGLRSDWLDDYAAEAQGYGLQLDACQAYVSGLPAIK